MTNANSSAQRTLILVKPDGVRRGLVGEVIARVERKGYKISALRMLTADKSMLETHYAEHKGKPFYEPLNPEMPLNPLIPEKPEMPENPLVPENPEIPDPE